MIAAQENTPDLWRGLIPFPTADSHKYSRGIALIRGGAVMTGAARLAARAAQRIGAGLVTVAAPAAAWPVYATALESVIVRICDNPHDWAALVGDRRVPALLIGPGLGIGATLEPEIRTALAAKRPCVLDADALSGFAGQADDLFEKLHAGCVLTPHEGEFTGLFGAVGDDRLAAVRAAARRAGCVVLLKGAETIIVAPNGDAVINRNAPPWLATAGSGDVLAGITLGLIAQKMPVFEAACAAAWLHGEIAARFGCGLIAEDIVAGIPAILKTQLSDF